MQLKQNVFHQDSDSLQRKPMMHQKWMPNKQILLLDDEIALTRSC